MSGSQVYIGISIVILIIVAVLVFAVKRGKETKRLTPLANLAFVFVFAGLLFGGYKALGYSFLGVGTVLAAVDLVRYRKATKHPKASSRKG